MTDIAARLAALSPAQREAFEKLLREKRADAAPAGIRRQAAGVPAPVSFGQERLWFLHRLDPQSSVYNVHTTIDVSAFEAPVVRRAVQEIVRRHDVLRTTFSDATGVVMPTVADDLVVPLPVVDLRGDSEEIREARLAQLASDHAHEPFDLERGPLVRGTIVEVCDDTRLLLIAMHHIVTDGWSMDVFSRELRAIGAAFAAGAPSPLAPLGVQYGDFAAWQRARFQGAALEAQLDWWRRTLEGAPRVLELPTDRARPAVQSDEGAFQSVVVSQATSARLRELARREGTTLFSVLLAAFNVWLWRYTGQHDLVVGLPVGGRSRSELEPLIGFFVNTVVLRTDLSGDPAFTELVARTRQTTTNALAHQDLPFERLVAALAPDRHLSRAPLFQVMAQLLGSDTLADDQGGGPTEPGEIEHGTSLFDLSIDFIETPGGVKSTIQYSTDLFEHATITRWLRSWRLLLDAVAADSGRAISSLPVMSPAERTFVVDTCNATAVTFPPAGSISALVAEQVGQAPDALAIIGAEETLTYRQLQERVAALAEVLRSAGVGPEVIVGVCLDRSPAFVVAILAVLEAGGAYVPIDPSTPADRMTYMLDDTSAPVLLTTSRLAASVPAYRGRTICLDTGEVPLVPSGPPLAPAADIDALAYVIYTSGSTGRPKGVMVTQAALVNFVRGAIGVYGFRRGDRVLQFASISFDTSIEEIFGSLATGATLVMRTPTML